MAAPTDDDIQWLRDNPGDAAKFEAHFGVSASKYITNQPAVPESDARAAAAKPTPTENDIVYLNQNPDTVDKFSEHFGVDGQKYMRNASALQDVIEYGKDKSPLTKAFLAPARLVGGLYDIGAEIANPRNWLDSAKSAGDVVSRIPDIVSDSENLKEVGRGALQGALTLPGTLGDIALSGVDMAGQIALGNEPLQKVDPNAYANNPLGSGATAAMLEDWGNKATDAVGLDKPFDFSDPGTDEKRTARAIGAFGSTGAILGGIGAAEGGIAGAASGAARGAAAGATGALGAETAREVAPGEPDWQAAGGILGSGVPWAVGRGIEAARATPRISAAAAEPLSEGGRENIVGNALREAAGGSSTDLQPNPLGGFEPTLGQQTNNQGILALEKTAAKSSPTNIGPFKDRLMESHGVARQAIASLRGTGMPGALRDVADQALDAADHMTGTAEGAASTGLTPAQASAGARNRIEMTRAGMRRIRQDAWNASDLSGEGAMLEVAPAVHEMSRFMGTLPKFYDQSLPADVQETLGKLNRTEPLSEFQALRSELGDKARDAAAQNNSKMAHVYGGLRDALGNHLDDLEFPDPDVQSAYQTARNLSRAEARIFKQPNEMRSVLGRNSFGGLDTAPERTLEKLIKGGPAGRDTVRQILDIDNSPQMQSLIGDHLAAKMPDGLQRAQDFMEKHQDTLSEIPMVRDRLQTIVDRRAAADALRRSPISIFAGKEPDVAMRQILNHPDRINTIRRLRAQLSQHPHAWDGMRAAYVDEILRTVESAIERDDHGNPAIKPGVMNTFYRENADATREILGPVGDQTLGNVADAVEMMSRTSRGGYPGGSDTFSMLSGDRFVDHMIEKWLLHPGAPYALAGAGLKLGGPLGAIGGIGVGYAGQAAFGNAKIQIQTLLRDALLDPAKGRALMLKATPHSLNALPRPMRQYLKPYVSTATGATQGASQVNENPKPRSLKIGQTVSGIIEGKQVNWKFLGGDPKQQASWQQQ